MGAQSPLTVSKVVHREKNIVGGRCISTGTGALPARIHLTVLVKGEKSFCKLFLFL